MDGTLTILDKNFDIIKKLFAVVAQAQSISGNDTYLAWGANNGLVGYYKRAENTNLHYVR